MASSPLLNFPTCRVLLPICQDSVSQEFRPICAQPRRRVYELPLHPDISPDISLDIPLDIAKLRCEEDIAQCKDALCESYTYIFFQKLRLTFGSKIRQFLSIPGYREIFMSIYSVLLSILLGTSKNPKAANKMQRPKSPPLLVFY